MGKRVNKRQVKTPHEFAYYLLEQGNRIHKIENVLTQYQYEVSRLVNDFNKANLELAKKIQALESKVEELERVIASKSEPTPAFGHDA